ncbi:Wzz/FepE/Etk N-terminal domain-containing protein [Alteromonas sp. MTD1]|uniref:Wzz/FepE/Etk N-terminal domain-containing protein n=1 Tax=Alteromonas sp. MTD1 TaxID=3057962 RepID=UPI0036F2E2AB
MKINNENTVSDQKDIANRVDIKEIVSDLWEGKWIIIASTVLTALITVFYSLSIPNIYKSEVLLAPVQETTSGGISGIANQFGGLASLAGVNLSNASGDKVTIALELLKSRQFIGEFIDTYELKATLLAVKGWDQQTNTLIFDTSVYDVEQNLWVRDVKAPKKPEPSYLEAHKYFVKEVLSVGRDKETGLITASVKHVSPIIAQSILTKLIESVNSSMRQSDIADAQKSIDYLNDALTKTSVADMQQVFYQLIEKQQQTKMLASIRDEYVLEVIDPAIVAEEKVGPKRALMCVISVFFGGLIGVALVLTRKFLGFN